MSRRTIALLVGVCSALAFFGALLVVGQPFSGGDAVPRPAVTVPSEWLVPPVVEPAQPVNVQPGDPDGENELWGGQSENQPTPGRRPGRPGGQRPVEPAPARPAPGRPARPSRR